MEDPHRVDSMATGHTGAGPVLTDTRVRVGPVCSPSPSELRELPAHTALGIVRLLYSVSDPDRKVPRPVSTVGYSDGGLAAMGMEG